MNRRAPLRVAILGLIATLGACSSSTGSHNFNASGTNGTPIQGGVAVMATQAGAGANYILPLEPSADFLQGNAAFSAMMWRPLYWYGVGDTPSFNPSLSLANTPTYSRDGKTVTITLKHYFWSDGVPVTTRDVEFWENLVAALGANYGGYIPGGYPANIVKTKAVNSTTITFTTDKAYNKAWFFSNELSNIIPLPQHAWDKTSATGTIGNFDRTTAGAKAVFRYLDGHSQKIASFATDPLWQVVDGPWRLTAYDTNGNATFVPNPRYSGPIKPRLDKFEVKAYVGTAAEYNSLRSGQGPDVGYISPVEQKSQPALDHLGYTESHEAGFGVAYDLLNYNNPTVGPLFKQLYIRQALELTLDQVGLDKHYFGGMGFPDCGPIPPEPDNSYIDAHAKSCPYAYNPSRAAALLSAHGWTIVKNGTDTCARPGTAADECGAGIAAGQKLSFPFLYASGGIAYPKSLVQRKDDAGVVGIDYELKSVPSNELASETQLCHGPTCTWGITDYGWVYQPDYYPTGEEFLASDAGANAGGYSDPKADQLIKATTLNTAETPQQALDAYQDYMVDQLPVLWEGGSVSDTEVRTRLHGVVPENVFGDLTPEEWYYVK